MIYECEISLSRESMKSIKLNICCVDSIAITDVLTATNMSQHFIQYISQPDSRNKTLSIRKDIFYR